jgi:pimeloyl-ACP methyl ester carboxylesterase
VQRPRHGALGEQNLTLAWLVIDVLARNWALVAMVGTIATLVLVPVLVLLKYIRISLNIMRTTQPPLSRNPRDFERPVGEEVTFPAYDGLPLNGLLLRAPHDAPSRGFIVFAHEFGSDMYSCGRYCGPLRDVGYDILTFDFRGHGQSPAQPGYCPRQWLTDRDLHDMRGALAFAQDWLERHGRPTELGIFGISRGACAGLLAACESPSVRAIVADGAFSTDTTIEYFMRRWAYIFAKVRFVYENHPPVFWRFLRWGLMHFARREFKCRFPSIRKAIQRMPPRPILFIHGEKDSYLPVEYASGRLYALAGQPKYLWVAPGARHNQAVVRHQAFYSWLITTFFDRHLARTPQAPPGPAPALAGRRVAAGWRDARPETAPADTG